MKRKHRPPQYSITEAKYAVELRWHNKKPQNERRLSKVIFSLTSIVFFFLPIGNFRD